MALAYLSHVPWHLTVGRGRHSTPQWFLTKVQPMSDDNGFMGAADLWSRVHDVDATRAVFGDLVDRLAAQLGCMDPAADGCVEALDASGEQRRWMLALDAYALGDALALEGAPDRVTAFARDALHVPLWADHDRMERGGRLVLRTGVLSGLTLGLKSLVTGYAAPAGNKPLVFSGRLETQAATRLNETTRFVHAVCSPGGMKRGGEGLRITMKVRLIHARVRQGIARSGRWDTAKWGAPINQHDMLATILLFSTVLIDGLTTLGVRVDESEADDYVHLWRFVGRVLGVRGELLPATAAEARRLQRVIDMTQGEPDDDSRALVAALLSAPSRDAEAAAQIGPQADVAAALMRLLMGGETSDALGVPRTRAIHAARAARGLVGALDRFGRLTPRTSALSLAVGSAYWDKVVEFGRRDGPALYDGAGAT